MRINMPMVVTAADTVKRTISGTIVTWNEQGNTSVGPTVFAADSIEMKPVKLLLEHDRTRPIGKMPTKLQKRELLQLLKLPTQWLAKML
jgi:hypothetical protein